MLESQRQTPSSPPAAVLAGAGAPSPLTGTNEHTLGAIADRSEQLGRDSTALLRPESGRWIPETWAELRRMRKAVAQALAARGINNGDRIAVISQTRWEWGPIDLGTLSVGAVTVGIYPTSTPAQIDYILRHSRARVVFVENDAQLNRLNAVLSALPGRVQTVVIEPSTAPIAGAERLATFLERADGPRAEALFAAVRPEDLATLVYTSGTTGPPKAVALTHRALAATSRLGADFLGALPGDLAVSYLPMAHVLTRVNYYGYIQVRGTAFYAESLEKVSEAWLAARPTMLSTVPRVLEKAQARILKAVAESNPRRRAVFARALAAGLRKVDCQERGQPIPRRLAAELWVWERLVFRKLRARLGWNRVRFAMCGGAPIRTDILRFFHAVGVTVIEGFGMTETASPITCNHPTRWRLGTVGRPLPGIEVKIASDGEILVRSPGLFSRYEDDPEATQAAFEPDGFFRTGDVGELDAEGYLRITDRKRDLIITAGGKNVAPQNLEALLKADPRVSQAAVFGDRRPYLVALVTIAADAPEHGDPAAARALVERLVADANRSLAPYETVKHFDLVAEDFTIDNGLLTPTLKVKRREVEARYRAKIDALYER